MVVSERGPLALCEAKGLPHSRTVIAIIALVFLAACGKRDPIARLASVKLARRPIEARLSGGFAWAPMNVVPRRHPPIDAALAAAVVETLTHPAESAAAAQHARALAEVLMNRPREAASALTVLARSQGTAPLWNDLAAARYTSAVATGRAEDLMQSLTAVDLALRMEPQASEALFNRALIVERLGVRDAAIAARDRVRSGRTRHCGNGNHRTLGRSRDRRRRVAGSGSSRRGIGIRIGARACRR